VAAVRGRGSIAPLRTRWRERTRQAVKSQVAVSTTFSAAKPAVRTPRCVPIQIDAAAHTSPARTRKVSITALALYFSSRETTR
jgi:hypothetical protein